MNFLLILTSCIRWIWTSKKSRWPKIWNLLIPEVMFFKAGITFFINFIKRLCIVKLKELKKSKMHFVFLVFIKESHYDLIFESKFLSMDFQASGLGENRVVNYVFGLIANEIVRTVLDPPKRFLNKT